MDWWAKLTAIACEGKRAAIVVAASVLMLCGCAETHEGLTVTIGGTTTANTPGEEQWLRFKHNVEAASGGQIRLRPLIYGQLGSEEQLLSGLRRGRIQFANLSAQMVSTIVPELGLLYAPFLFGSYEEADWVYDNYLTDLFRELLAERDLYLVTWYEIGFHHVYGRRPILTPADARGRRFRVSSALNARLFAEAIGADLIPLGFGDIVPSLQTGLIESGENAVTLYARTGIAGEAPHLVLTGHVFGVSVIVSRLSWWESLPAAQRRILSDSFPPLSETRAAVRAETAEDIAGSAALGFVVHELGDAQLVQWRAATARVTGQLVDTLGGRSAELLELIEQGRREFKAQTAPEQARCRQGWLALH
ncbi:MAG: TRAP transporter substrate-binding protein [Chromatiales bacterium]|nr:TRAP transporter substrate-binding protein [Chromatiales bacterium]